MATIRKPARFGTLGSNARDSGPAHSGKRFFTDFLKPILLSATAAKQASATLPDMPVPDSGKDESNDDNQQLHYIPDSDDESEQIELGDPQELKVPEAMIPDADPDAHADPDILNDVQGFHRISLPTELGKPASEDAMRSVRRRMSEPPWKRNGARKLKRTSAIEDSGDNLKLPMLTPQAPAALSGGSKDVRADTSSDLQRNGRRATLRTPRSTPLSPRSTPLSPPAGKNFAQEIDGPAEAMLQGLAARCVDCGAHFGHAPDARNCLVCGGSRVENQLFNQLFNMFAMSQTLRKAVLPQFITKLEYLLKSLTYPGKKSGREQIIGTTSAFNTTLESQRDSDCMYKQGITIEFFPDFLFLIAENLDLTCRGLMYGLLGKENFVSKGTDDYSSQGEARRVTLPDLSSCDRPGTACASCGCSILTRFNLCCKCGHKKAVQEKKDPLMRFSFFKGSQGGESMKGHDFTELVRLAQAHHVPLSQVRSIWQDFQHFNVGNKNVLQREDFAEAVRSRYNIPRDTDIPEALLKDELFKYSPTQGEFVDFEAFILWSLGSEYEEELLAPDPQERNLRELAYSYNLLPSQIDKIKGIFDQFDDNKRGFLDESSFMQTALHLAGTDVGHSTLKRWWQEVSLQEKAISFETFLSWYLQNWSNEMLLC